MAIFHLRARTATRAGGASAAASAAYLLRLGKYSRPGLDRCVFSQAGNMPSWASSGSKRLEYWRAADLHERANGRLFKSLEFALPRELSPAARFHLALQFCERVARTNSGQPLPFLMGAHEGKGGKGGAKAGQMALMGVKNGFTTRAKRLQLRHLKNGPVALTIDQA